MTDEPFTFIACDVFGRPVAVVPVRPDEGSGDGWLAASLWCYLAVKQSRYPLPPHVTFPC